MAETATAADLDALFTAAERHFQRRNVEDGFRASAQVMRALAEADPRELDQMVIGARVNHLTTAGARAMREPW